MKKYFKLFKEIHLHTGLFISPFLIIFAGSALILNHNFIDWQEDWQEWTFSVDDKVDEEIGFTLPEADLTKIEYAKNILRQAGISGEIANIFGDSVQMYIPVTKPGYRISVKADLVSGTAYIHTERTNFWKKLIWLHKMPGPHNANIRGNWVHTRLWGSAVDFSMICLFISSITGIVLWFYFKKDRIAGIIALLIGLLSFSSLIIGFTVL